LACYSKAKVIIIIFASGDKQSCRRNQAGGAARVNFRAPWVAATWVKGIHTDDDIVKTIAVDIAGAMHRSAQFVVGAANDRGIVALAHPSRGGGAVEDVGFTGIGSPICILPRTYG
jgi:hypothetical protein